MPRRTSALVLAAVLAALPVLSPAQEPPPEGGPMPRTQENLITFKLLRMTQVLELTEDQTARIYPFVTRLEKEKMALSKKVNDGLRSLRELLRQDKPDESRLLAAVDEVTALRLSLRGKDSDIDRFLKSELTVKQYAAYTLFLLEFNRSLGEKLDRARGVMRNLRQNRKAPQEPKRSEPF